MPRLGAYNLLGPSFGIPVAAVVTDAGAEELAFGVEFGVLARGGAGWFVRVGAELDG